MHSAMFGGFKFGNFFKLACHQIAKKLSNFPIIIYGINQLLFSPLTILHLIALTGIVGTNKVSP